MKVVLLDGYSLMYRAYHALADAPMTAPDGTPTTAVHGFLMMLFRILETEKPDRLAVAFDAHAKTFRHNMFTEYKGTRAPMPDDLRAQDPVIREIVALMGIRAIEKPGWEADDILGTISRECEESGDDCVIVTGDRDSYQLVGKHTKILYTKRGITDTQYVDAEYIAEKYGIEPKQLIDVKSLMGDSSDNIPGIAGIGEKTALKLISQYGDLETALSRADAEQKGKLRERLIGGADEARMSRALAEIDRHAPIDETPDSLVIGDIGAARGRLRELGMNMAVSRLDKLASSAPTAEIIEEKIETTEFSDVSEFARACEVAAKSAKWAAFAETEAFSVATGGGCFSLILGGGDLFSQGVTADVAARAAAPLLDMDIPKYACASEMFGAEDISLMAYVVNPQRKAFTLAALCGEEGETGALRACGAVAVKRLYDKFSAALDETGTRSVYTDIEKPLANVLREMEREGFLVDDAALREMGERFRARIAVLTDEIYELAGEKVNINSPKQLSELLFVKLGLPAPKKTSQGFSTSAETLEALAEKYPICDKILEYRKHQKLESTYVEALLRLRDGAGRVHTRFDQTATATGRISSMEPNLQNIPVRTELGRAIREAFIARPGWVLIDGDYSQIELRVLAHMANDDTMINAFLSGEDIHRRTAAEVNNVPIEEVTGAMRSAAKAINFGIVYGISDFTLARNISVSRAEAKEYIEKYFARYPGVKAYLDGAVESGKRDGYVSTLMGRRRYLPELDSSNFNIRAFGERCAMNSPIQGTAADIIKLAMVKVAGEIKARGLRARLILQVHDELLIEAPEDEADAARELLRECMEGVFSLKAPLRADISQGRNWLECK